MLEKNLEEQKMLGLGEHTCENPTDSVEPTNVEKTSSDDDGLFGKPEKYDYSQVELPENYCYNEELLDEFNGLAGKYNLSQKSANELMSVAIKLMKLSNENFSKTIAEEKLKMINEFKQALVKDVELGGAGFEKSMKTANIAYTKFADSEVQSILNDTGLNCHPKIVKMFYNIGKEMQNDTIWAMNSAVSPKENREDILFPTM